MTKNPYIAGLAAGGVAALLYLSLTTGSAIGLMLFYLAPLPGFIAGFGWGVRAAITAALAGTFLIVARLGLDPAIAYAATLAIPCVIITHFFFLYRVQAPSTGDDTQAAKAEIEWYPVGNIVLIVAVYGGVLSLLTILLLGPSYEAYLAKIGTELDLIMSKAAGAGFFKKLSSFEMAKYKKLIQDILPASTAVLWCLFAIVNMWIAARIVHISGLMSRPWPDLSRIEYPRNASFALFALMAFSVILSDLGGLILSGFAGALMLAFVLLGLAVVHYLTRPFPARGLILFATYVAVLLIGWGALVMVALGVIEPLVQIRKRAKIPPV